MEFQQAGTKSALVLHHGSILRAILQFNSLVNKEKYPRLVGRHRPKRLGLDWYRIKHNSDECGGPPASQLSMNAARWGSTLTRSQSEAESSIFSYNMSIISAHSFEANSKQTD